MMSRHLAVAPRLLPFVLLAAISASTPAHAVERRTAVVTAVERASPAVVSVRTEIVINERYANDPFEWFFRDFGDRRLPERETLSQGSGVIIEPSGFVLTNYHVVSVGGDIEIEFSTGGKHKANVVGTAPEHDLAVLKVQDEHVLPHIPMGRSNDLMIGETVIAIGNPFGLSHTVTTGVISALHRFIRSEDRVYSDFIQTDASINPGNSGGPLLNIEGELIGVNTAIYGRAQGIGFAIPIDKARRIVSDLLRFGEVRRPFYGFEVQDLTAELAKGLGVSAGTGVLVSSVDEDGPAAKRLRIGDVVISIGGARIADREQLRVRMGDFTVDSEVPLQVSRDGRRVDVVLRGREMTPKEALALLDRRVGLQVVELGKREARRVGLPAGTILVKVVRYASPARRRGIVPGDWIRAVNSEKVFGLQEFAKSIARSYLIGRVTLLVQRGHVWQQIGFDF